jgi:hypothetical protein
MVLRIRPEQEKRAGSEQTSGPGQIKNYQSLSCFLLVSLSRPQMSMYFAPAFFAHLLGRCFQKRRPFAHILKLGVTVISTFALLWSPYLGSTDDLLQVSGVSSLLGDRACLFSS